MISGEYMKKILKALCIILIAFVLLAGTILAYLSVDEYKPEEIQVLEIEGESHKILEKDKSFKIMTWNIGYGALGDNADFFMDGGKMVYSADKERVNTNLSEIKSFIEKESPDILLTQEIDRKSARSHFVDEVEYFRTDSFNSVFSGSSVFATNFKVAFVPLPVPPIGKVHAGINTFSDYTMSYAVRQALPCPFSWPLSSINLKRCLEVIRMPVADSDNELVLVNLHLEAYDDGEGKIAQTKKLEELLESETQKGNYVIAGGDFNQVFSNVDDSKFPVLEGMWEAGKIDVGQFDCGLTFLADENVPSCRSLDKPLAGAKSTDPKDFQYYIIDGFIVSPNVEVESVNTADLGFVNADHNPVVMRFKLK